MRVLAQDFRDALFGGDSTRMLDWIRNATQSGLGLGPLVRFGFGLKKYLAAVTAAVDTPWSSGLVEGQINRLKAIKRQMYGRAPGSTYCGRVFFLSYAPRLRDLHGMCGRAIIPPAATGFRLLHEPRLRARVISGERFRADYRS